MSEFKVGEYVRSAVEVLGIAKDAAKLCVADAVGKVDEWLANYGDSDGEK